MSDQSVDQLLTQGVTAEQWGQPMVAVQYYRQVLAAEPEHGDALLRLGRLVSAGNPAEGIQLLRRSLAANPDHAPAHIAMADVMLRIGQADAATTSAERARELAPEDPNAHATAALCFLRSNRVEAAFDAVERAIALDSGHVQAKLLMASVQRQRGELEAAREALDDLMARSDLPPFRRDAAQHELAMVLDRLGEYEAAYGAIEAWGRSRLATQAAQRQTPEVLTRRLDAWREVVTPELLERAGVSAPDDLETPVFMVGFPRSGTTMTEQILAAHPRVLTTGELPLLNLLDQALRGPQKQDMAATPGLVAGADATMLNRLRDLYWDRARAATKEPIGERLFLDKLPLNIIDVGFINVLFPKTRLVVALRDPRDVCLSCVMQKFGLNVAMVNFLSLERTVAFYTQVMGNWLELRDRLTIPYLEVRYEDTVTDLPTHARKLIDFLGLEWDDAILGFHESARDRYILTPSYAAVTEPVHTRAVGRWRNYREHFEPHLEKLRPFVEAFGYEA